MLKRFGILILILGITTISTACTNTSSGQISFSSATKFDKVFKNTSTKISKSDNVIYLGEKQTTTIKDISFEFDDLRR